MADVLSKLIGRFPVISSVMTNEITSYKSAKHFFQRWRQSSWFSLSSGDDFWRQLPLLLFV